MFIHPYDDSHQDQNRPDAAHGGIGGGTGEDIFVPEVFIPVREYPYPDEGVAVTYKYLGW